MLKKYLQFLLLITLLLTIDYALARAGGGGGHGGYSSSGYSSYRGSRGYGGGGINGLEIWILVALAGFIIYSAIVTSSLNKKSTEAQNLLQKLKDEDPMWNYFRMKARIEEVFFTVQQAWTERNQEIAKHCMSERIFLKHKLQTDAMIKAGRRNILEDINLEEAKIICVADFKDNTNDYFIAYLSGKMVDYHLDDKTNSIIRGDFKPEAFQEIWHFTRQNNCWVLDEIGQNASYNEMVNLTSTSEAVIGQEN